MVMSQGSIPAAKHAADISRSPLLPSSRMMATRTLSDEDSLAAGVNAGVKGSFQVGALRVRCALCSASTHSSAHWGWQEGVQV